MKAQAYYEDPRNMIIRVFPGNGTTAIADLPLNAATPEAADHALRQMRLRRNGPWKQTSWGREARIHFANSEL